MALVPSGERSRRVPLAYMTVRTRLAEIQDPFFFNSDTLK